MTPSRPPDRSLTVAVWVLSGFAIFAALYFARTLFIPITLACVLALVLAPIVRVLSQFGLARSLASGLVVVTATSLVVALLVKVSAPATAWFARVPEGMIRLRYTFSEAFGAIESMKSFTEDIAKLAPGEGDKAVVMQGPDLAQVFLTNTGQLVTMAVIAAVLLYFLLANGNLLLTKTVHMLPNFSEKKRAVGIGRDLQAEVSRYLLTITLINLGLGAATALIMTLLGLADPLLWGAAAAVFNFIPYAGAILTAGAILLASLLTFPTPLEALYPPLAFMLLTALEGNLITPILVGRRLTLNPVIVFTMLLFWGWLWGIAGLLLAVPLLVVFKILCGHIGALAVVGEYLSSAPPRPTSEDPGPAPQAEG